MTVSAGAVYAYHVVRTIGASRGERAANKILFGTQMCTYKPCTANKLKWFRDFQQVKWGLTGCDICALPARGTYWLRLSSLSVA
jgi:hypothetical protein